jgi:hypothetical protein
MPKFVVFLCIIYTKHTFYNYNITHTHAHTNTLNAYVCVHVCVFVHFFFFASSTRRVLWQYIRQGLYQQLLWQIVQAMHTDTKTHVHNDTRPHVFSRSLRYHRLSIYIWGGHSMRQLRKRRDIKKIKSFLTRLPGEDMKMNLCAFTPTR